MAGEDPGASIITLLLDLIRRGWDVVTSTVKTAFQTGLFIYFRKQMMRAQQGPKLKHGKQRLKHLRRHEERGAQIVSVEIGDRDAMKALDRELKALKIDYSITKDRDGEYVLHYKSVNEKDVLMAQKRALEQLYGDPDQINPEQETPSDPGDRDQQDRDDRQDEQNREEQSDRGDRSQDDSRQNEQDSRDEQERQNKRERQDQQEQERNREQSERNQRNEPRPVPAPVPVPTEVGKRANSLDDKVKRGKHVRQEAPALAERMPLAPSLSQQAPKTQAQSKDAPQFEPLESLIAKARERAAAKNAARKQDLSLGKTKDRVRAREVSFGH